MIKLNLKPMCKQKLLCASNHHIHHTWRMTIREINCEVFLTVSKGSEKSYKKRIG